LIKMKDILTQTIPIDIVKDFGNEILEYYRNGRLEDWMDERLYTS